MDKKNFLLGVLQAAMVFGSPVALFLSAFTHRIPVDIERKLYSLFFAFWLLLCHN